ncbi:MAG: type II secretion system protein [Gloeobacteraceae cyanobacterium ES-bin-144]|nr:type II secretion system protein [Verrucomicrobiales bacterium]
MTNNLPPRVVMHRGMTLLELTIVIMVLLSLASILMVGARAWKNGSDRTGCILNMRNMQMAARSYQNLYGYNYGGRPYAENGTQDIVQHMFDKGYIEKNLYDGANGVSKCPSGGGYVCAVRDVFPQPGALYMTCSLATSADHMPKTYASW